MCVCVILKKRNFVSHRRATKWTKKKKERNFFHMCFFSLHPGNMIDLYTFSCYDYWTLARQQGGCLHLWRANHLSLSFQYTQRFVKGETRLFSRNVWQEEQDVRRALPYTFFPIYGVEEGRGTRQVKQEGSQSVMPRVYLNCVEKPPLAYSDCNNSAPPPTHNTQTFCFQDRRLFFSSSSTFVGSEMSTSSSIRHTIIGQGHRGGRGRAPERESE